MNTAGQIPLLIGLTGSIGAGKSTVAGIIREQYPVLDTDRIARDIMESDDVVRNSLTECFGSSVFHTDGTLDSQFLASVVFADAKQLGMLNEIVHPPTILRVREAAVALHAEGSRLVFVESALVFEAGIEEEFDYTVAVISDPELSLERIMQRDGIDRESAMLRLQRQLPPEEKARLADFTIRNNSGLEELRRATGIILLIVSRLGRRPTE
jgi:dephospho-CoA kinase